MDHAGLLLVRMGMRREEFCARMSAEVEAGRTVMVGWFEQNESSARIVVGAEDGKRMANIIDAIEELSLKWPL